MVRRAQSRKNTWLVASKSISVARSSKTRVRREAIETSTIASTKQAPILTPSGRSITLLTVVYASTAVITANAQVRAGLAEKAQVAADAIEGRTVAAAARDFGSRYGCPDVVIANAGVSLGTLTDHAEDVATFQDVLDINVMGIVKVFQPFIAGMRERGSGTLAGIASVAGYRGLPGAAAYSASKAAAISYLESLRVELKKSGVRVERLIFPTDLKPPLYHEFQFDLRRPEAQQALEKSVEFLKSL